MKIIDRRRSLERCTESGWDAEDLLTDSPVDPEFVLRLRKLEGSLLFMKALKKPFFKLEYHDYVIKGVVGDDFFRMAYHRDSKHKVDQVIRILSAP